MIRKILFLTLFIVANFQTVAAQDNPKKPLLIGATVALTGKLAFSGTATQRGLQLGIEAFNESGGVHGRLLSLVVDDNAGEANRAVTGVTRLLDGEKADIMFSSLSHITQAIRSIVEKHSKIMIYAASIGDIAAGNPLVFRDWGDIGEQISTLGQAVNRAGITKIAIVGEQSEASVLGLKILGEFFKQKNIEVVAEEMFNPGEVDFKSVLLRAGSKKPQAFVFCAWRDSGILMKQLKETPFFSLPTFHVLAPFLPNNDIPEFRKLYAENGAQSVWTGFVPGDSSEGQAAEFTKEYLSRFGEMPRSEAAFAYDDIQVLGKALKACRGIEDASCVVSAVQRTEYMGVAGKLRFDDQRRSNRESFMIKIENGNWVKVSKTL